MLKKLINHIFSFQGRLSNKAFGKRYFLIFFICFVTLYLLLFYYDAPNNSEVLEYIFMDLITAIPLAAIISSAITSRRLHDLKKSGLNQILYLICFIPSTMLSFVGQLKIKLSEDVGDFLIFMGYCSVILLPLYVFFILYLIFKRGTVGPNKYGNDPLETNNV